MTQLWHRHSSSSSFLSRIFSRASTFELANTCRDTCRRSGTTNFRRYHHRRNSPPNLCNSCPRCYTLSPPHAIRNQDASFSYDMSLDAGTSYRTTRKPFHAQSLPTPRSRFPYRPVSTPSSSYCSSSPVPSPCLPAAVSPAASPISSSVSARSGSATPIVALSFEDNSCSVPPTRTPDS